MMPVAQNPFALVLGVYCFIGLVFAGAVFVLGAAAASCLEEVSGGGDEL